MLVSGFPDCGAALKSLLAAEGYQVATSFSENDDLLRETEACDPDAIVIETTDPSRRLLAKINEIKENQPRPIAMFSNCREQEKIQDTIGAGVNYLVPTLDSHGQLGSAIDLAIAHFNENSKLRKERDRATTALAERKTVDRAKGIIMKQRGLDENAAYNFIRQTAMNRNIRVGQLAASIIEAEELLG